MKITSLRTVAVVAALLMPAVCPADLRLAAADDRVIVRPDARVIARPDLVMHEAAVSPDVLAERLELNRDAINEGRVVALSEGRAEVVNLNNLSALHARNTTFVATLRSGVAASEPPPVLTSANVPVRPVFELPYEILVAGPTATPRKLVAWARDSTGLSLSGAADALKGMIHVALTDRANPSDTSTLTQAVQIAISAPGAIDIDPSPVSISALGQWQPVSITVQEVEADEYEIAVSANPASTGEPVKIAVIRPTVRLWSNPGAIVGWGIGQATINVSVSGMPEPAGFKVPLSTTNGSLDADVVTLDRHGLGNVPLRSSADPETVVGVERHGVISEPLTVRFKAPWVFLLAAIAGGLTGAFLRGRARKKWIKALAIGVASALVMTLAYAIGIDWMARLFDTATLARTGEALVFVLGAIGALIGVNFLIPSGSRG